MQRETIEVVGAKQNNLKNIDIEIPRDKITVITGVSGSGKSSLAFDVIYGEAQRRFLDTISNSAKTRIEQVKRPNVDAINGLSPVVAIEQIKGVKNPRSTIGTITDINDYMRLLFATAGVGKCPECGCELNQFSAAQIAERMASQIDTVFTLSTLVQKTESYAALFESARKFGYKSVLINGETHRLSDDLIEELDIDESGDYITPHANIRHFLLVFFALRRVVVNRHNNGYDSILRLAENEKSCVIICRLFACRVIKSSLSSINLP